MYLKPGSFSIFIDSSRVVHVTDWPRVLPGGGSQPGLGSSIPPLRELHVHTRVPARSLEKFCEERGRELRSPPLFIWQSRTSTVISLQSLIQQSLLTFMISFLIRARDATLVFERSPLWQKTGSILFQIKDPRLAAALVIAEPMRWVRSQQCTYRSVSFNQPYM